METSVNGELLRIYDLIRRLQDDVTNLAKEFYETSAVSYDEISGTPETLSSFENDMNYISSEEVDLKIESIPPIDDSNYLKKKDKDSQECTILTHFKDITATTQKKDDCSDNVATTQFVHSLIEESSKSTEKYISGIYSRLDAVSSALMKEAIKKALKDYYDSGLVDSKIELIISELYIPTKTSDLRNDSGFITIDDIPQSPVTSVNGLTGDVTIQVPTVPTNISSFTNDVGYITDPGVTSVNNQTGAVYVQENIQANWSSTSGLSAILNKPALKRVATTGSYNDLDDKPTIPTNTSELTNDSGFLTQHLDISGKADIEDLAAVAFSGSYIDLSNKPTIPTNLSELTNDNNFVTLSDVQTEVSNLVDLAPETLNTLNELALALGDDPNFATTVAAQIGLKQDIIADLETIRSGAALGATALQSFTESDPTVPAWAKESSKPSYSYNEITDKPDFATVATSGDYDDLSNKPTIPTVPTNVSAFINDAGYLTDYTETDPTVPSWAKAANKPSYTATEVGALPDDTVLFSGDYNDLSNKPDIPDDSDLVHKVYRDDYNYINETNIAVDDIRIDAADVRGRLEINDEYAGEIYLNDEYDNRWGMIKGDWGETLQQALDERNNVQSDWNQTVTTADDYIKNKPTIPANISELTNDSNFATLSEVQTEVSNLVDQAPETLNTLNELAAALGDDPNFATTVSTQIGAKYTKPSTGIPYSDLNASVLSSLDKADTALQSFTETDPTVPAWAKASTKPTYTAVEVGALPDTTVIPQVLDYPLGTETDAAPSVSAVQRWISEVDFRTYIDDNTIGINSDEEMYVKSLSADKLTNGTNNKVFTASEQTKLSGIAAGAEVNVQSDWNETNTSSDAFIKNKPNIVNSIDGFSGSISTVSKRLTTASVPNVTSVGSASTWNFSMGTGNDIHTLIITGNNSTTPTLGTSITVATGSLSSSGQGGYVITGISGSGGSND